MSRLAQVPRGAYRFRPTVGTILCFQRRDTFMNTARYWQGRGYPEYIEMAVVQARVWNWRGVQAKRAAKE